jgi:hypothetical protein
MTTRREALTTLIDFEEKSFDHHSEPESLVRKKKLDLSGGTTMWQARLVLSTLDPESTWAAELRQAIRRGDIEGADQLLDLIYARNNHHGGNPASSTGPKSQTASALGTVLPPEPLWDKLEVG